MDYQFFPYQFNTFDLSENYARIFTMNGVQRDILINDFNSGNLYDYDFISCKYNFDEDLYRYLNNDGIQEGLIIGYCYCEYDSGYSYLNINSDACSFVQMFNMLSSDRYINGYYINPSNSSDLTKLRLQSTFQTNQNFANFHTQYTLIDNYLTNNSSLMFDFSLSSNLDKEYTLVRDNGLGVAKPYNSCFVLDSSDWRFGFGKTTYYTEEDLIQARDYAFDLGFDSGKNVGYSDGLTDGYYNGLNANGGAPLTALDYVGSAISNFTPVFSLEVMPNITLGTCISIPIIVQLLVIIFKIARG